MKARIASLWFLAFLFSCADHREPELGAASDALACSPASLVWSGDPAADDQLCAGAWRTRASCVEALPACPDDLGSCKSHKTCPILSGTSAESFSKTFNSPQDCQVTCEGHQCDKPECEDDDAPAIASCQAFAQGKLVQVRNATAKDKDQVSVTTSWSFSGDRANRRLRCTAAVKKPAYTDQAHPGCGCAVWNKQKCERPAHECAVPGAVSFTAPGLTREAARQGNGDRGATCTTCEQHAEPLAQLACLESSWAELGGRGVDDPARRALLARLQRFYDVHAASLDAARLHRLGDLAWGQPGADLVTPGCGDLAAVPEVSCDTAAYHEARADLLMCHRLGQAHLPAALVSAELGECLSALAELSRSRSDDQACGGPALRAFARDLVTRLLLRQQPVAAVKSDVVSDRAALVRQLVLLDTWYRVTHDSLVVDGSLDADEALFADLSAALAGIWDAVYSRENPFASLRQARGAGADVAAINAELHELVGSGYAVDQAVVLAAFTFVDEVDGWSIGRTPLVGLPLLALLADALTPLERRIDSLSLFHDFACTLMKGCGSVVQDTPVARTWQLLASLASEEQMHAVVVQTTQALAGWKAVFSTVAIEHEELARGLEALGHGVDPAHLPRAARPLARLLSAARARHEAFRRTGQLDPTARRVLASGVDIESREDIIAEVDRGHAELESARREYNGHVLGFVSGLLGEVDGHAGATRVRSDKLRLAGRIDELDTDLLGLGRNGDIEEARFGDLASRLEAISAGIDGGAFVQQGDSRLLHFSGASASWPVGHAVDARQLGAASLPGLSAGQLLVLRADGQYKPTCALREIQPLSPVTEDLTGLHGEGQVGAADATVGPEGFQLTWSNSGYKAQSNSLSNSTTLTTGGRGEVCEGTPQTLTEGTGFSAKVCLHVGFDYNLNWTGNQNDGGQQHAAASFASGLRLRHTPFPLMPAGALLLVFVERATGRIVDSRVVASGANAFVVPADGLDAYFVVNDRSCAGQASTPTVNVSVSVMVDAETAAAGTLAAMAAVLRDLRGKQAELVGQGALLPSQTAGLRSFAMHRLDEHVDLDGFPAAVRRLFDAFVDKEILAIERRVQMHQLERERHQLLLQAAALEDDLAAGTDRARLGHLLSRWAARNLDSDQLRERTAGLLAVVRTYFLPILELWYPGLLEQLEHNTWLERLLLAEVDTPMADLVDTASSALGDLREQFRRARLGQRTRPERLPFVLVSFPNPFYEHDAGHSSASHGRGDPGQALALWTAIQARGKGDLRLRPEDLYTGLDGKLPCKEHNPIIQRMALYVVRPGEDDAGTLNPIGRTFSASVGPELMFARSEGPTTYQIDRGIWEHNELPIVYGEAELARPHVENDGDFQSQRPLGLSPFTTFTIDFSPIARIEAQGGDSGFDEWASELVVVIEYDSKAGEPTSWLPGCQVQ